MKYIRESSSLAEAFQTVSSSSWAAIDTEADSLHHYVEKLSLFQVSVEGEDFVFDPLVPLDFAPIIRELERKSLIFHGADFDIRMLRRAFGFVPKGMFDTMIAAQLLGYDKQGLADLALKHCEVTLPKTSQKADWSRRPLEKELIEYAANDTHYLFIIKGIMEKELAELGRLEWHRQFCERVLASSLAEDKPPRENAWQVKGSGALKGKSLTFLKELWRWREEEARRRDRPSFKVLHGDTLVKIAQWAAEHPGEDVAKIEGMPRPVRNEFREALNRVLKESSKLPQAKFQPRIDPEKKRPRLNAAEEKKLAELKAYRQSIAENLKIQPSLLVTNAVLERLVADPPKDRKGLSASAGLLPWQENLMAEGIFKILKG